MHKYGTGALHHLGRGGFAICMIAEDNFGAVGPNSVHLECRCGARHDDPCREFSDRCRVRNGLTMVAGRMCHHARGVGRKLQNGVRCPARFECAYFLEILGLEEDVRPEFSVECGGCEHRGSVDERLDSIGSGFNVRQAHRKGHGLGSWSRGTVVAT